MSGASADPFVGAARAAVSGIREALEVGKEAEALGEDIAKLGVADVQARAAYRKKKRYVSGDSTIIDAVDEWRRLKEIEDLEKSLKQDVVQKYGIKEWEKILAIKERKVKESKEDLDEFGRDIKKLRALKWWCFIASCFVTAILYSLGMI